MFDLHDFMGKKILESSLLEAQEARAQGVCAQEVCAFFTTRDLPLKAGELENLKEEVEHNKKLVCDGLGIPAENLIIPQQTHSENIKIIKDKKEDLKNTDALITAEPNVALALNFADCVPLLFFDPVKKVAAAAHAGWRGTAAQIAKKTVLKMQQEFSSNPEDIIALIGPCIGQCCFEVKEDVKEKIFLSIDEKYRQRVCNGTKIDLQKVNKFQLLDSGLIKIDVCEYCTSCNVDLFFSYRKENANTARHSAVIMLRGE